MAAYQAGELAGFRQLYAGLAADLRRYFRGAVGDPALAEDLVQDTFLQIHRARHTYQPALPVTALAFGVARHALGRWRREARRRCAIEGPGLAELAESQAAAPAPALARREIEGALARLPPAGRDAWLLHHVHGFSFAEIAARLRIGVGAAKLRSSRAMRALRETLGIAAGENPGKEQDRRWLSPKCLPTSWRRSAAISEPVEPLTSPGRRLLFYLPVGLLLIAAMPWVWGLRVNAGALGFFATWGLSAAPGAGRPADRRRRAARSGARPRAVGPRPARHRGGRGRAFAALTFATQLLAPNQMPPGVELRFAWECFWMATTWSVPALAAAAWLAYRALPTRPAVAGAICGLGAGLIADAGVRLFCWVSEPVHVLLAHGGSILFLVALGAAAAVAIDRWR